MRLSSKNPPDNAQWSSSLGETRREALGRFLRERREALAPEQVGISSHRGRRTPGLRREEVAFLSDIGVKWYARLEAGDEIQPSAATLSAIAVALRLSTAELEYMLDLAGLNRSFVTRADVESIPHPLQAFISGMHGVAAAVCDRILTPLYWNGVAEALHGHSRYQTPIERNGLVRALFDPESIAFLGAERESLVFNGAGMLRLNYSSEQPSPFAADVYARVKDHPLFQDAWKQRVVTNELYDRLIIVRNHAVVGRVDVFAIDSTPLARSDLSLRVHIPATAATAAKFERLEQMGKEMSPQAAHLSGL